MKINFLTRFCVLYKIKKEEIKKGFARICIYDFQFKSSLFIKINEVRRKKNFRIDQKEKKCIKKSQIYLLHNGIFFKKIKRKVHLVLYYSKI